MRDKSCECFKWLKVSMLQCIVRDCYSGFNILLWYFSDYKELFFMIIFVSLQAYSVLLFGKLFRIKKQKSFPKRKT